MTTVERADLTDVGAVVDAWVELAADQRRHGSHILPDANRDAVRETAGAHALAGGLLVAREGDELVGFVMFGLETGGFERDVTPGLVRHVWVRPDRRGEGIGSDLLEAAERRLAELGADVATLEVLVENDAARAFYRRLGYRPHRHELAKPLDGDGEAPE